MRTLRSQKTFGYWKSFKNDKKCFLFHLITIFPNISRNNDNHAVKFGQLIEYKMRNNVIQKNVTWGGGGGGQIAPPPQPLRVKMTTDLYGAQVIHGLVVFVSHNLGEASLNPYRKSWIDTNFHNLTAKINITSYWRLRWRI